MEISHGGEPIQLIVAARGDSRTKSSFHNKVEKENAPVRVSQESPNKRKKVKRIPAAGSIITRSAKSVFGMQWWYVQPMVSRASCAGQ